MNSKEIALIMGIYLIEVFTVALSARLFFVLRIGNRQKRIIFGTFIFALTSAFLMVREINMELFHLPRHILEYSFYGIRTLWWFSMGMIISNLLHYFVWNGILFQKGETLVHRYVIQFFDGLVYTLSVLLILNQVFHQSIVGLLVTSGGLAIILGLSAQTTLGGVFSGLALNLNNSFQKGDYIILEKVRGYIVDMNWHSVTIKARDERKTIIPNKLIDDSIIINSSNEKRQRLFSIAIKMPYEVPPQKIKELLLLCAAHSSFVLENPLPKAFIRQFSEKGIDYVLEFYTNELEDILVSNDILTAVWYNFSRKGIAFKPSLLQEEVNLESSQKTFFEPINEQYIFEIFRKVPLFSPLSNQEIEQLVQSCQRIIAAPPERITIENDKTFSLFVIEKGSLDVLVKQKDGSQLKVAQLNEGQIFGEMALLTGERRKATVRAATEVILYEISKENIFPIIQNRQEILNDFSRLLAERQYEILIKSTVYEGKVEESHLEIESLNKKIFKLMVQFFDKD